MNLPCTFMVSGAPAWQSCGQRKDEKPCGKIQPDTGTGYPVNPVTGLDTVTGPVTGDLEPGYSVMLKPRRPMVPLDYRNLREFVKLPSS